MTAVDAAWLENPSSGASRKMRRPIVCTIRQPPSDVPTVSARPQASIAQSGTANVSRRARDEERADDAHRLLRVVRPVAEREPGDIAHCAQSIGRRTRSVARRRACR